MGKRRGGFIWGMIDLVMTVLTLAVATGIIFAYAAPSVNPNKVWIFAYAGLAAPILYLVNLFFMLYWAIRWKPLFFLPALLLLVGIPKIKAFYHFSTDKNDASTGIAEGIKIMTYNVEGFIQRDPDTRKYTSSAWDITNFIRETDPDIVCIQEFQSAPGASEEKINDWLADWPYRKIAYTINREGRGVWGSAIYSKYPILDGETIDFEGSRNGALWVELLVSPADTLRVICNHLETTYVKDDDLAFLQPENFANDPDKSGQIRKIAGRLRKGFRNRAHQADTLASLIAGRDIPTVVCGDFNDPPISYAYHTIRNGYSDTFEDKGSGYGYTYKRLYRLMRIDYILRSPHLETLSYRSPDTPWSDHKPVIASVRLIKPAE